MGWRGKQEGGSGRGTHVNPWLIHVNVWQKPLQYCKVISLQLIKINGKKRNVPLVSLIYLKIPLVFPILLFSSISLHWSLRKAFLSLLAVLWNSAFRWVYLSLSPMPFASLPFSAMCKASSNNHFAISHLLFLEMVVITASCTMSWTSIHSSSSNLSVRSNPLSLLVPSTV